MVVSAIVQPLALIAPPKTTVTNNESGTGFGAILNDAINKLSDIQNNANDISTKFVTGEVQDVHQVTIAMEEAKLSMQLALEVRNKAVEAYQEISRMQL